MDKRTLKSLNEDYSGIRSAVDIEYGDKFDNIQDEKNPIIYDGNRGADIMVIARDLGYNEVQEEKPLIGKAGQLFRKLINFMNIEDNIYMTNLVPYKPKDNKVFPDNVRDKFYCLLMEQIDHVDPEVIVTLGKKVVSDLFRNRNINSLTGFMKKYYKKYNENDYDLDYFEQQIYVDERTEKLLPCYHPSYLLRKGVSKYNVIEKINNPEENDKLYCYFYYPFVLARKIINKLNNNK